VEDGLLSGDAGEALMTEGLYDNFELEFDWRVEQGADSGVFYHVDATAETPGLSGPEMQIVDDQNHPDAKGVMLHASGSAYDVLPPTFGLAKPSGEFNRGRIVVDSGEVEHWVNGIKVVDYDLMGPLWRSKVNGSLFASEAAFARAGTGHIVIESKDAGVAYRNIRIRHLEARERAAVDGHVPIELSAPEERELQTVSALRAILLDANTAWFDQYDAVRDLAHTAEGVRGLIALAESGEFPGGASTVANVAVSVYADESVRDAALEHFPAPRTRENEALPSFAELGGLAGDAARGKVVFAVNCQQCHVVDGVGTDFGPEQSDVGNRLTGRELYEAVLDPSASIAAAYTPYMFELRDGRILTGFIVSEEGDVLTIRIAGGIIETLDAGDVLDRREQALSAMPGDLYQIMSTAEMADLFAYLGTLRK
jgi:putative heme-binding domain-containing protein